MITGLNEYQRLIVCGTEYTVTGMIAYTQGQWNWKEYQLKPKSGKSVWLSIESYGSEPEYILYSPCGRIGDMNDYTIEYQGRLYQHYEKGTATVTDYFGRVDVDRHETVRFSDFENKDTDTYLSIEDWEGEKEYTFGQEISAGDIQVLEQDNDCRNGYSYGQGTRKKKGTCVAAIGIVIAVVAAFIVGKYWIDSSQAIQKYLENNVNYKYVTSITNSTNNKKARVYATDMGVDETVQHIIKGIPRSVKSVLEGVNENGEQSEDGGVGLIGSREYAYIYVAESGETYIQVSSEDFMEGQTNSYHSTSSTGYYRTYYRRRSHAAYASVLASARQSSVSARKSSGGGTSVGK